LATERGVNITAVCCQLGYSKQAYYKAKKTRQSGRCHRAAVLEKVLSIRRQMPRLGVRKLYHLLEPSLQKEKIPIGRDKLFQWVKESNLLVSRKKRYVKTTDSRHWMRRYPNLVKGVVPDHPEQHWVADITYITTRQGFSFLHLLTDAYSKKIMGYELCNDMLASSTLKALRMALANRQYNSLITHHSDRGLQYSSATYLEQLKSAGLHVSMTQDGSPYDNAVAERINGILKDEFGLDAVFDDFEQLKKQAKQSIETYNVKRPHLSCSFLTPQQMHN
jgi:putative transposase